MSPLRRLLVSHALAAAGMSLPWPLLLLLVWDRVGGTPSGDLLLGLTGAARMLPYVALSWATGRLADRCRRDRLLRVTLVSRLVLLVVVTVALGHGWVLTGVLAAAAAVGCGTPAYPALAAAMPGAAGDARRRATELLVTIEVASFVVGPAVGGLLLAPATRPFLPAVAVAATAVALLFLQGIRLPVRDPGSSASSSSGSVLGTARRSVGVPRAIGTVALLNAVLAAVGLALLPLATAAWDDGGAGFGLATGVLGFGALAAPLLCRVGRSSVGRTRGGLVLLAGALTLVPLAPHVGWAVPSLALAGAAGVHVEGAATETIQDAVPDSARAGVLGLTDSVMVGAALAGSLLAPALVSLLDARLLLVLMAAACAVVVAVPEQRRPRKGPATRPATRPAVSPPAPPSPRIPRQRGPARPPARWSSAAGPRG